MDDQEVEAKCPIVHVELFADMVMTEERRRKLDESLAEFRARPENRVKKPADVKPD